MEQRLSIVTLGVADVARARGFYEALGWTASRSSNDEIVFFQLAGMALALYAGDDLAEDARVASGGGGSARITLAHNAHDRAEVDRPAGRGGAGRGDHREARRGRLLGRLFGLLRRS